jgi:hypothetical protein
MSEHEVAALASLPLADIERACRRETERYRRREPSDGRFCLEMFRRALARIGAGMPSPADEAAGDALTRTYTEFSKANINRAALPAASVDDLVQQVWLRFWQAAAGGLAFPTLEQALAYLKLTTMSTLLAERRRAREAWRHESLDRRIAEGGEDTALSTAAEPFSAHVRRRFRERCREVIYDSLEWRVFWWKYGMGMQPREIAAELAQAGELLKGQQPSARAVSDLLDRIFKRLEVDPELRDLLRSD